MTNIGEIIATTADDLERTKRGIDGFTGSVYRFSMFTDNVSINDNYLKIQKRLIGSAFVLGHGLNGKLSAAIIPQPMLGETNIGAWTTIIESGAPA